MERAQASDSEQPPEKHWWRRWEIFAIGLLLGAFLIVPDGYVGEFQWALAFSVGTGLAVAAFWHRRTARWFLPSVAFLIIAHVIALVSLDWRILPHHVALQGAGAWDFAVSGLFLYCVHRLFEPPAGPRAHWSTTAKLITAGSGLIFLGISAFVATVLVQAHNEKIRSLQIVFSRPTAQSSYELMDCIDMYKTKHELWDNVSGHSGKQLFDDFNGRLTRVLDTGAARVVQVATVRGRPLHPQEQQLLSRCLA